LTRVGNTHALLCILGWGACALGESTSSMLCAQHYSGTCNPCLADTWQHGHLYVVVLMFLAARYMNFASFLGMPGL
jgi:hypothetical protein